MIKRTAVSVVIFSVLSAAAVHADQPGADFFDRPENVRRTVAQAEDAPPVWVSVANADLQALEGEFNFRALAVLARSTEASVFGLSASQLGQLSESVHRKLHKCGGFFAYPTLAAAEPAYTIDQGARVRSMLSLALERDLAATITALSAYRTRYFSSRSGADSAAWLLGYWQKLAAGRDDITVEAYKHAGWPQNSVILTVRGVADPGRIVVLGGHLDSISRSGSERRNAATPAPTTPPGRRTVIPPRSPSRPPSPRPIPTSTPPATPSPAAGAAPSTPSNLQDSPSPTW